MKNLSGLLTVLAIFLCAYSTFAQSNYVKRINCGKTATGDIQYLSETFNPDRPADEGFEYTGDNLTTNGQSNFTLGDVFKPTRYTKDPFMRYEFPVTEAGDYRVILHFAEVYHGPGLSGQPSNYRRFNVEIENTQNPEDINLAVFEAAGNVVNGIYTINRVVNVTDGKVTITISQGAGNDPIISAIEVLGIATATIPVTTVSSNPTNVSLEIGATEQLTATVSPSNATNQTVTWTSNDASIVDISSNGLVTANAAGNAIITVTTNNGLAANSTVIVTNSNNPPSTGGGEWVKNENVSNIFYNSGNVGIGTQNPTATSGSNYLLAVDGKIRSREVKVDNDNWADYVFLKDYQLPTLQEVEKHIKENGHLINIPSAKEVEANGIELGEMNKLLLEKIEELTLYILVNDKKVQKLKLSKNLLQERLQVLEQKLLIK